MRRGARIGAGVVLLALAAALGGSLACGRYGPPVRAEEYREQERMERQAEQERKERTTPQERNEPLPPAP